MGADESLQARVSDLEIALGTAFRTIERNRYDIAALRIMLCTLIDSFRPDDPAKADEWIDAMAYVAAQNAALAIDLASDAIIRDHGVDSEMLAAMEDERKAVTETLESIYAMLKRPQGGMVRE